MKKNRKLLQGIAVIGSLELTVVLLCLLSVLVVWGTLYQVNHGIYAAQQLFFNTWFTIGPGIIPLPAVKTIVALLSLNLIAAAIKKRPISIKTIGMFIIHIGVAVLVASSAIASGLIQESAITLKEGQSTSETYNFSSWHLTFTVNGNSASNIHRFDLRHLQKGQMLTIEPTGIKLKIDQLFPNCSAMISPDDHQSIVTLKPRPLSVEEGQNIPGITLSIPAGSGSEYNVYAGSEHPIAFSQNGYTITTAILPLTLKLPVNIQLKRFDAQWHPGTSKAKSFTSQVRVFGKNIDRDVVIEMNRPFRFDTYTFYQMGYNGDAGNYSSTLAVIKNPLRFMPYIASFIIVTGLFLHFFIKMLYALSSTKGNRHATAQL